MGIKFLLVAFILIFFLRLNSFESSSGIQKSVADYFREAYQLEMQYDFLPCLQVGTEQRPNYLPMEVANYELDLNMMAYASALFSLLYCLLLFLNFHLDFRFAR